MILFTNLWACTYPLAAETPAVVQTIAAATPAVADPKHNAVLIVIDTLRWDALEKADTPAIDGLAARGQKIDHAWSMGTWTVPSVTSMFTGMTVREHGWDEPAARMGKYPKLPEVPLLAEIFQVNGFVTTGFYSNPYLDEPLGFNRGFDEWTRISDSSAVKKVQKEVAGWTDGKRHFMYLHLLGPHSTLRPSAAALEKWKVDSKFIDPKIGFDVGAAQRNQEPGVQQAYVAAYHAQIEDTDLIVAGLVDALGPYLDDTAIVLTSDHGEMLGEHGKFAHGKEVWDPLVHVPFVAVNAGPLPQRICTAAVPDVLTSATGITHAFAVRKTDEGPFWVQREGIVAVSADTQTVGIWKDADVSVFDLAADPDQNNPLAERVDELTRLKGELEAEIPAGRRDGDRIELGDKTKEELKALGYAE